MHRINYIRHDGHLYRGSGGSGGQWGRYWETDKRFDVQTLTVLHSVTARTGGLAKEKDLLNEKDKVVGSVYARQERRWGIGIFYPLKTHWLLYVPPV